MPAHRHVKEAPLPKLVQGKSVKKPTFGEELVESAKQALAYVEGKADGSRYRVVQVPSEVDVRLIRRHLKLTQEAFAARFGFGIATIRDWEQGRSHPVGAQRAYLMVIKNDPKAVDQALRSESMQPA
jgi:putative transcriptional regulator